jgi:hypothetical protein
MHQLRKRLCALEHGSGGSVDLLSSDRELCRFLASTEPAELRAQLSDFSDAEWVELQSAIREHVPTYGRAHGQT